MATCTVTTCSCTQTDYYLSSNTYQTAPAFAWFVFFLDGYVTTLHKSTTSMFVPSAAAPDHSARLTIHRGPSGIPSQGPFCV